MERPTYEVSTANKTQLAKYRTGSTITPSIIFHLGSIYHTGRYGFDPFLHRLLAIELHELTHWGEEQDSLTMDDNHTSRWSWVIEDILQYVRDDDPIVAF